MKGGKTKATYYFPRLAAAGQIHHPGLAGRGAGFLVSAAIASFELPLAVRLSG